MRTRPAETRATPAHVIGTRVTVLMRVIYLNTGTAMIAETLWSQCPLLGPRIIKISQINTTLWGIMLTNERPVSVSCDLVLTNERTVFMSRDTQLGIMLTKVMSRTIEPDITSNLKRNRRSNNTT